MAVKLRLARFGKTGAPLYRLIAIDEHKARNGRAIETLGNYNPHLGKDKLVLNKERLAYWLSVGAQPTATVASLLKKLNS